jgi:predicted enzyme related to lactoylglutathione lyase
MQLHEIELFSNDPDAAGSFYSDTLGLKLQVNEAQLKVFDAGVTGVDLNISNHYPSAKVSLSFLVKDVNAFVKAMKEKKIKLSEPYDSHLGLKAVTLTDNDGCRIVVHSPTAASPQWLRNMV